MPADARVPFSDAEYRRRWANLRHAIDAAMVDLALLHDADTIVYLTGFGGTPTTYQALAVPRDGEPVHLLRYAEAATFAASSWLATAATYDDRDDPTTELAALVQRLAPGARRIGIEAHAPWLSLARYRRLEEALPGAAFVDLSLALGEQRLVRSEEEIAMHRRACLAIERGLAAGIEATIEGATERDIAAAIAPALIHAGTDLPNVGVIGSGERLGQVHGGLSDRRLRRGDLVRLEQSNSVNRYWARIMRMLAIGPPPSAARELYEQLREAQDAQLALLVPGAIPEDLDAFVRARLPRDLWSMQLSGYALAFHERSVIGGEADRYRITAGERRPLQAGMVLHMYLTYGDVSISETVVVRPGGAERLTTWPRDFIVR